MMKELNLIEFSDLHRRKRFADRKPEDNKIVELARNFVGATTNYYPEHAANIWPNSETLKKIKIVMNELGSLLNNKAEQIVLPLSASSFFAEALKEQILPGTPFKFQSEKYDKDYSDMKLDADVRTALDEGYRGMFDVADGLIYKWDRQMKENGQLSLAL